MQTTPTHGASPSALIILGVIFLIVALLAAWLGLLGRKNPRQRWWLTAMNFLAAAGFVSGGIVVLVVGIHRATK